MLMVMLPQCHYSEDQALSCVYCQKYCLKITHSQGNWYPQSHSESWLPGIPISLFLFIRTDHGTGFCQYECELSIYPLIHLQYPRVCKCVFQARQNKSLQSCRAVNLRQSQTLSAILQSLCSVIWPASVADTVKTRVGFSKTGLTECLSDVMNAFLRLEISHIYCYPQALFF